MTLSPMCNVLMAGRRPETTHFLLIFLEKLLFFSKINARKLREALHTMRKISCERFGYQQVTFNTAVSLIRK